MSTSRKSRRLTKRKKKSSKKSEFPTCCVKEETLDIYHREFDDGDKDVEIRKILPYFFRPSHIKFRKKHSNAVGNANRRSRSLPAISILDEAYTIPPSETTERDRKKLTRLYDMEDVDIIDCRSDSNSEDELLQLWYEESRLETTAGHSDSETKVDHRVKPTKRHAFADTVVDKEWLDFHIMYPYASDSILKDPLTRPYFDPEYESFLRQNWILLTHRGSLIMPRHKPNLFKVLTKNRPRNILSHLRLGYCVTYTGACLIGSACQNSCQSCGVCRHQYQCSCRKHKRYGWCCHIHAAVMHGKCKFDEQLTVYVSNSNKYMQTAHIRASCYDYQNIIRVERDVFEVCENSATNEMVNFMYVVRRLVPSHKHKCPAYKRCPECNICRHMFSCNCADYDYGNLCDHCHLVFMYLSKYPQNEQASEFDYASDCSDSESVVEAENQVLREDGYDERLRQVVMTHERSNCISMRRIEVFLESPDNQLCYAVHQSNGEDPWFIEDYRHLGCNCRYLPTAIRCPACLLCDHQMICYCSQPNEYSCKHLHAINRYLKVHFNSEVIKYYDIHPLKNIYDWNLLDARRKRAIKRRISQSKWPPVSSIDLTRKGRKKENKAENISENDFVPLEHVAKEGYDVNMVLQEVASLMSQISKNEARKMESQLDENNSVGFIDNAKNVVENVGLKLDLVPVAEKNVKDDTLGVRAPNENAVVSSSSWNTKIVSAEKNSLDDIFATDIQIELEIQPTSQGTSDAEDGEIHLDTLEEVSELSDWTESQIHPLFQFPEVSDRNTCPASSTISEEIFRKNDLPEKVTNENKELALKTTLFSQSIDSNGKDLEFADSWAEISVTNEESKSQSACKFTGQQDSGYVFEDDFEKGLSNNREYKLQTSFEFSNVLPADDVLEGNLDFKKVPVKVEDCQLEIQLNSITTGEIESNVDKRICLQDITANINEPDENCVSATAPAESNDYIKSIVEIQPENIDVFEQLKEFSLDHLTSTDKYNQEKTNIEAPFECEDQVTENVACESQHDPTVASVEEKGIASTVDTQFKSDSSCKVTEIEKCKVDSRTTLYSTRANISTCDAWTQTDLEGRCNVYTQTNEFDFFDKTTSDSTTSTDDLI